MTHRDTRDNMVTQALRTGCCPICIDGGKGHVVTLDQDSMSCFSCGFAVGEHPSAKQGGVTVRSLLLVFIAVCLLAMGLAYWLSPKTDLPICAPTSTLEEHNQQPCREVAK